MLPTKLFRYQPKGFSDLLPYAAMIDDGVCLLKDGTLMAMVIYDGRDMQSSTQDELISLSAQINGAISNLGDGWGMNTDLIRAESNNYNPGAFIKSANPLIQILDMERQEHFESEGVHYQSTMVMTFFWQPPLLKEQQLTDSFVSGIEKRDQRENEESIVAEFMRQVNRMVSQMSYILPMRKVGSDEMLTLMESTITGKMAPRRMPEVPMYLDVMLSQDFTTGFYPSVNGEYIGIVSLTVPPGYSFPGMIDGLNYLAIPYRFSTRFLFLSPTTAKLMIDKHRKKWKLKQRGFFSQLFQTSSGAVDLDAVSMTDDAEVAMSEASSDAVRYGFYTANILVRSKDQQYLQEQLEKIEALISNSGFAPRIETINATEAFLGSLPANGYPNVRRPLLHTLNLAHLMPTTSVWPGLEKNPCPFYPPNSPPLFHADTQGATPFRFGLHVGDVGHTMILGPTGSGKSTLLVFLMMNQFRYPDAQVFCFDKGYSSYVANQGMGGIHYDLGSENSMLALCPLADLETKEDIAWAQDYIESILTINLNRDLLPAERNSVMTALEVTASSDFRSLTDFSANLQSNDLREALAPYTAGGAYASIMDGHEDSMGVANFTVFEMEHLMEMGEKLVMPVLLYMFRKVQKSLKGNPTLLVLDEAWIMLSHPIFKEKIREWLKVLRKANAAVVFATQSISDVMNSDIRDVLLESCPTKIFLPNPEARSQTSSAFYKTIGLNEAQIDLIAYAQPKRQYYYMSPLGRRLFELSLGPLALMFCAKSSKPDVELARSMIKSSPKKWVYYWIKSGEDRNPILARYADEISKIMGLGYV